MQTHLIKPVGHLYPLTVVKFDLRENLVSQLTLHHKAFVTRTDLEEEEPMSCFRLFLSEKVFSSSDAARPLDPRLLGLTL